MTFEKDEIVFKIGDPCDGCFIVVEGEIGIYFDREFEQLGTVLTKNSILGERGLRNMALTRHVSCKAHSKTTCLALSKEDFIENVFFIEKATKTNRLNYIKTLPFVKGWPIDKINKLNSCMNTMKTIAGEKIYSQGAFPEVMYIV